MTRDTQVIDIIETNTNKEPSPIGFLLSYLPNSSKNVATKSNGKFSPPYPIDASSSGTFPIPSSIPMVTNNLNHNNYIDIELNEISTLPTAPNVVDIDDVKILKNSEKQEFEKELSKLKIRMLGKTDDEKRAFLNDQHKVLMKIDSIKLRLSDDERNDFEKKMREIDDIRKIIVHDENVQEIDGKDSSDEINETNNKCIFDISSLLPKFPQLVRIFLN